MLYSDACMKSYLFPYLNYDISLFTVMVGCTVDEAVTPVSYTHLDVYKRQGKYCKINFDDVQGLKL